MAAIVVIAARVISSAVGHAGQEAGKASGVLFGPNWLWVFSRGFLFLGLLVVEHLRLLE